MVAIAILVEGESIFSPEIDHASEDEVDFIGQVSVLVDLIVPVEGSLAEVLDDVPDTVLVGDLGEEGEVVNQFAVLVEQQFFFESGRDLVDQGVELHLGRHLVEVFSHKNLDLLVDVSRQTCLLL